MERKKECEDEARKIIRDWLENKARHVCVLLPRHHSLSFTSLVEAPRLALIR